MIDTWHSFRPEDHPGRVWKAVAKLTLSTDIILQALDTCLDWTSGRPYNPEWFVRDVAAWVERSQIVGLWQRETARDRYLATHK